MEITQIIKRDYETSPFVLSKIASAVEKAMLSVGNGSKQDAETVAVKVLQTLLERKSKDINYLPNVEQVQDLVEDKLMESSFHDVAKATFYTETNKQEVEKQIFLKKELI